MKPYHLRFVGMFHALMVLALPLAAGCPAPKVPRGPAPEYEPPARPPWMDASGAEADAGPDDASVAQ